MSEKSSLPLDSMRKFRVYSYGEASKTLDKACQKAVEKAKKWDAEAKEARKAGGQA